MSAAAPNYLPKVREQYEALPYPPVDPEDDYHRLAATIADALDYLNHRFYDGHATFKGYRVLSAGDGTGNASIYMAEQLSEFGGEVVAIDMSAASQAIAKRRAEIRGLTNITFIHGSLLDIPTMGLGEFDYVSCSGVLHHLADPDAGLRTLINALKPDGVLGVMVYAQTGRTGIYHMQHLLRELLDKDMPIDEQIALTRTIIDHLPQSNWLWHMRDHSMYDIVHLGDSGLYDLLLHSQDRAYTVPQIYEWVKRCGAEFVEFVFAETHQEKLLNPARHLNDPEFAAEVKKLSAQDQQHIADLLFGIINKHIFYATKGPVPAELTPDDDSNIPSFNLSSIIQPAMLHDIINMVRAMNESGRQQSIAFPGLAIPITLTANAATADLLAFVDGTHSICAIIDKVAKQHPDLTHEEITQQFNTLYSECREQRILLLRRPEGAAIDTLSTMQARSRKRSKAA